MCCSGSLLFFAALNRTGGLPVCAPKHSSSIACWQTRLIITALGSRQKHLGMNQLVCRLSHQHSCALVVQIDQRACSTGNWPSLACDLLRRTPTHSPGLRWRLAVLAGTRLSCPTTNVAWLKQDRLVLPVGKRGCPSIFFAALTAFCPQRGASSLPKRRTELHWRGLAGRQAVIRYATLVSRRPDRTSARTTLI